VKWYKVTDLAGQRPAPPSQRGPASGDGFAAQLRQRNDPRGIVCSVCGLSQKASPVLRHPRYFQSLSQRMFSQVMLPCTPLTPCGTVAGMNSTSPALIVCDCPPTIFPF
jgi:hypothetical protein